MSEYQDMFLGCFHSFNHSCVLVDRFLRHVPVIYVDHPGPASLMQIYGTFNRAMLRLIPPLRAYAEPLTNAMVDFYTMSQDRFTQVWEVNPHMFIVDHLCYIDGCDRLRLRIAAVRTVRTTSR